jgi:2-keto-4-pentenoate hydratase/2-oxohepta-3-ene-1,7-dioic acid hydratase in catechol pathway
MKFGTIEQASGACLVVQGRGGEVCRLDRICRAAGLPRYELMSDLIEQAHDDPRILDVLAAHLDNAAGVPADSVSWMPPLPRPPKILGVAFNNKRLMETAHSDPGVPNFFLKPSSALQGHRKPVRVNPEWGAVIPEPELCAIIGRRCKDISEDQALDCVFGYSIHNDVTSHGLKFGKDSIAVTYAADMARPEFYRWRHLRGPDDRDVYFVYHARSKGTDTFGPMGPWITTRDEVRDPNRLEVVADLDGEVFAVDSTSNYRYSVEACIAEASRYFTLEPGDVVSFGTTAKGRGRFARGHKSVLLAETTGTVGISIEPLGRLENPIEHIR